MEDSQMKRCWLLLLVSGLALAEPKKMVLLDVQRGEMPPDAIATVALSQEHAQKADGVTLKATFDGGSFGQSNAKKKDWTGFRFVRLYAFNPQDKPLSLYFATRDKETVNWETRADIAFSLQPGANNVSLDLSTLKRNKSEKPVDMTSVNQWYIACEAKGSVLYFGDIALESEDEATKPEEPKLKLDATQQGKKIILEGKIRIELERLEIEGLAEAKGVEAPKPTPAAPPAKKGEKLVLLDPNAGQTSEDHSAEVALSDDHAKELGGKSLKAVFKGGQAFGVGYWGAAGPANWQGYAFLRFEAFNPSNEIVPLGLTIRDKKTGYENRADLSFRLAPGLNKTELRIDTLTSNAGNQLDKATITQWYIACESDATLYFANVRLEKE
jgi:hypothetical protein